MDMNWLEKAIETIRYGICDKLSKDDITIYRVKNIIRIDIKEGKQIENSWIYTPLSPLWAGQAVNNS